MSPFSPLKLFRLEREERGIIIGGEGSSNTGEDEAFPSSVGVSILLNKSSPSSSSGLLEFRAKAGGEPLAVERLGFAIAAAVWVCSAEFIEPLLGAWTEEDESRTLVCHPCPNLAYGQAAPYGVIVTLVLPQQTLRQNCVLESSRWQGQQS